MRLMPRELRDLAAAATPQAWNRTMDKIREVRGGAFPPDWSERVVQSGLFKRARARWSKFHRNRP